jgi:ribonucleoside-diphosphate reductase alpha chain
MTESCALAEKDGYYETLRARRSARASSSSICGAFSLPNAGTGKACAPACQKNRRAQLLLVAPMPTASTSQILGNNECFEPYTSNLYTRRTLAGEHIVVNKHLMRDLVRLGLWDEEMREAIMAANGSIQGIDGHSGRCATCTKPPTRSARR